MASQPDVQDTTEKHIAWEVTPQGQERMARKYACCPEEYVHVTVNVTLSRRREYLNHLFVAPSVIIAFIIPVIFILPVESGAKVNLGTGYNRSCTLLMKTCVFQTIHCYKWSINLIW